MVQPTGIINARPDVVVFLTNNPNGVIGAGIELRALNFKGDFAGADTVAGVWCGWVFSPLQFLDSYYLYGRGRGVGITPGYQ